MRAPVIPVQSYEMQNSSHLMVIIQTLDPFVGKSKPLS